MLSSHVGKYLWNISTEKSVRTTWGELTFLLGLECYKDTQMKAYDITKLTTELKSSDSVWYRNK